MWAIFIIKMWAIFIVKHMNLSTTVAFRNLSYSTVITEPTLFSDYLQLLITQSNFLIRKIVVVINVFSFKNGFLLMKIFSDLHNFTFEKNLLFSFLYGNSFISYFIYVVWETE